SKVKGAMVYPVAVLVISMAVVAVLLIKVIPVFAEMFSSMGGELPGPTAFLVAASEFAQGYWWLILAIIGLIYFAFNRFYKTEKGRWTMDGLLLKLPLFGPL